MEETRSDELRGRRERSGRQSGTDSRTGVFAVSGGRPIAPCARAKAAIGPPTPSPQPHAARACPLPRAPPFRNLAPAPRNSVRQR